MTTYNSELGIFLGHKHVGYHTLNGSCGVYHQAHDYAVFSIVLVNFGINLLFRKK